MENSLCDVTSAFGHVHILQWLRSQDPPCPWNENTCSFAAGNGHLHLLQWLRSLDPPCPWVEKACSYAAEWSFTCFEVVKISSSSLSME